MIQDQSENITIYIKGNQLAKRALLGNKWSKDSRIAKGIS